MLMQKIDAHPADRQIRIPPRAAEGLDGFFEQAGAAMRFEQGAEIFGEGEPTDYFYKVTTGAVRICKLLSDGRRQIGAFYLPGDVFGLEASDDHQFSAEAVVASTIQIARRSAVIAEASRDGRLAQDLWTQTATGLGRAQEHMLLLGRKNAQERVASFLLEMAKRVPAGEAVELPMSRQDIADYLGLTIETVSRTLTQLEGSAAIALPSCRRILLRNHAALQRLNA